MGAVGCRQRHRIIDYTASLAGIKDQLPESIDLIWLGWTSDSGHVGRQRAGIQVAWETFPADCSSVRLWRFNRYQNSTLSQLSVWPHSHPERHTLSLLLWWGDGGPVTGTEGSMMDATFTSSRAFLICPLLLLTCSNHSSWLYEYKCVKTGTGSWQAVMCSRASKIPKHRRMITLFINSQPKTHRCKLALAMRLQYINICLF